METCERGGGGEMAVWRFENLINLYISYLMFKIICLLMGRE